MNAKQIATITNDIQKEIIGETALQVAEDLSNIVDVGKEAFSATDVEQYCKKLFDRIGKVVFVNRVYEGSAPSVLKTDWEYASITQKIDAEMPDSIENESWKLVNGQTYNQDKFVEPKVSQKLFNSLVTFDVPLSKSEVTIKSAFTSASQVQGFYSMIETAIANTFTIKTDGLIMRTIDNFIAGIIKGGTSTQVIPLRTMYNAQFGTNLSMDECRLNPDFIRFASYMIRLYVDRIQHMSTLFNSDGKSRFTPKSRLHAVFLNEFYSASAVYLESDTFHNDLVKLPKVETVPFWQGSGTDYSFNSTSSINVNARITSTETANVSATGIIGTFFDDYSLGVSHQNKRVTTHWNASAEFLNSWYKWDAGYFNDFSENGLVFTIS